MRAPRMTPLLVALPPIAVLALGCGAGGPRPGSDLSPEERATLLSRPQLDSAWCGALTAEWRGTVRLDTVPLWVLVDRWGRVDSARVDSSAALGQGYDPVLQRAARALRFLPWEAGPGWTLVDYPLPVQGRVETDTAGTVLVGHTAVPQIKNRNHGRDVVMRHYPRHLQEAGVGGMTMVWTFVDSTGVATNVLTYKSSGSRELDEAAERAVMEFEFAPAVDRGRRIPAVVVFPVRFGVTGGRVAEPPPREFTLGPREDPVAEATLIDPEELDALPDLVLPDEARERLSRLFLDSGPAEDLGLVVTLQVGADGAVQATRITERLGGAARQENTVAAIYAQLGRLRFRPGMVAGEPQPTTFSARLVFSRVLGLAPSPPRVGTAPARFYIFSDCAGADSVLLSGPQFTRTDEPPEPATPEWEKARLISDTWPIALQRQHESYEFQFSLLVDTTGGVCEAEVLNEPDDPWVTGKLRQIVQRLRFKPARLDGRPVATWYDYTLAFSFVGE